MCTSKVAREVEDLLKDMLGEAKGGGREEGEHEYKLMKERNRILLDVWFATSLPPSRSCPFP